MALSKEDHKDVKGALGKAVANKISKVTRDSTGGMYGDRAMKRFTANKERKHAQWDKEGKGK